MKLKGFTLTEVLLTILILGSVAALTLPNLNLNVQKQQAAPALIKAISLLDNAHAYIMHEEEFYSFQSSCIEKNNNSGYVNNCFEPFVMNKIGAFKDTVTDGVYTHGEGSPDFTLTGPIYVTQNGFTYYFYQEENKPYTTVLIDTNGYVKRPNQFAKDVFVAYIYHETGKVYAAGSKFEPADIGTNAWPKWDSQCYKGKIEKGGDIYCAGSIVDNNGNVIYPY